MPLINGMKMACEPCIRGHRSTKCNHANERLMVPVRKPGRPLSACPHPRDTPCGCGGVTAAIPRKQTCHCGSGTPALTDSRPPTSSSSSDAPSPKQITFKIGPSKVGKSSSSRKQSFDPANFERMDMSQVNMMAFEQRPHQIQMPMANGYALPGPLQIYGYPPQYPSFHSQFNHSSMQLLPHANGMVQPGASGYINGTDLNSSLEHVIESPLATPTGFAGEETEKSAVTDATVPNATTTSPVMPASSNGGSCCAPKKSRSYASSVSSTSEEAPVASCCSSKKIPKTNKESATNGFSHGMQHPPPLMIPPSIVPYGQPMYQHYPQTTVFTYPPTYGSFQNPLQPQAWRQSIQANNYSQQPHPSGPLPYNAPVVPGSLDTVHTCCCGDTCQCIGCAAHPYNDATQNYVRSAWASMSIHQTPGEVYTSESPVSKSIEKPAIQPQPLETVSSPTAHTPSSTASGNGEEQSLPAGDFFFVNYPFASDGCGGDTQSCPCGDDCECLGCTIHRQPAPVEGGCCGEKASCDCGDDCACLGCEFHGNA